MLYYFWIFFYVSFAQAETDKMTFLKYKICHFCNAPSFFISVQELSEFASPSWKQQYSDSGLVPLANPLGICLFSKTGRGRWIQTTVLRPTCATYARSLETSKTLSKNYGSLEDVEGSKSLLVTAEGVGRDTLFVGIGGSGVNQKYCESLKPSVRNEKVKDAKKNRGKSADKCKRRKFEVILPNVDVKYSTILRDIESTTELEFQDIAYDCPHFPVRLTHHGRLVSWFLSLSGPADDGFEGY